MRENPVRVRHVLEYVALRCVSALFRWLPYRGALAVGWLVAWAGHHVVRFRRAEARRRIRSVLGPGVAEREVRRIAWISFRNLCFNAVEIARLARMSAAWVERHVDVAPMEVTRPRIAAGRGVIMATPHAGNWDLMGVATHTRDFPVFFIARRQKNPFTDRHLNRMRGATGVETVLNDAGLLRNVIRHLRRGMMLAILPDVRSRTPALAIPFLGGVANLPAGAALFARQAEAPIYPAFISREGWARHRLQVYDPILPDPAADKRADWERMMRALMAVFDRCIRARPEQYFWYNKRWVLEPLPQAEAPVRPPAGAPASAESVP